MAINLPNFPLRDQPGFTWFEWFRMVRDILLKNNREGTSAPTTGDYIVGDFVQNSTPTELGMIGSKYIIYGWLCVIAGSPGTWKECRVLTGK